MQISGNKTEKDKMNNSDKPTVWPVIIWAIIFLGIGLLIATLGLKLIGIPHDAWWSFPLSMFLLVVFTVIIAVVIAFGVFRLWIAFSKVDDEILHGHE